jgi:hypothetical protein
MRTGAFRPTVVFICVKLADGNGREAATPALLSTRQSTAAFAPADLMSRRGLDRPCETLVAWAREA